MKPIATAETDTAEKPRFRRYSFPPSKPLYEPIPAGKNNGGKTPTLKGKDERFRRSSSPTVCLGQKLDDEP